MNRAVLLPFALLLLACGDDETAVGGAPDAGVVDAAVPPPGVEVAAEDQRPGDAAKGYTALVNEGYVGCGIPWSAYSKVFGAAPPELQLPGRTGRNATLPYQYTAFTTASGVEVVSLNCLVCHASFIQDQLVVGLGAAQGDFTTDPTSSAQAAGFFVTDPDDKPEYEKWKSRVIALGPHTVATTVGANPGDNVGAVLFAHRDRETLAWSDEPLMALPPDIVVPVDVPPWWRMAKKNAMFYLGAGRGDHARIMMTASTLCTDTVAEAQAIDAYFPDVRAYIASIQAPAWPFELDAALAEKGKGVFEATCSRCHGTYGAPEAEAYHNFLIPVEEVGTDSTLALGGAQFAGAYVDWFNESFYGEIARLEPTPAYYAPPLDGIWATAPYLHNGVVPTLAALLESSTRPAYWTRSYDPNDYDPAAIGWVHTALPAGHDAEPSASKKKRIIDTTLLGYGNGGHLYGDPLSPDDRAALLEYLKTL